VGLVWQKFNVYVFVRRSNNETLRSNEAKLTFEKQAGADHS